MLRPREECRCPSSESRDQESGTSPPVGRLQRALSRARAASRLLSQCRLTRKRLKRRRVFGGAMADRAITHGRRRSALTNRNLQRHSLGGTARRSSPARTFWHGRTAQGERGDCWDECGDPLRLVRRLEGVVFRRHPVTPARGRALLHARQGCQSRRPEVEDARIAGRSHCDLNAAKRPRPSTKRRK
jgi:hypothetical protein